MVSESQIDQAGNLYTEGERLERTVSNEPAILSTKQRLFRNMDLLKLFLPLTVELMLTIAVGLADSIIVATGGEAAVSGVSLVDYIMLLLVLLFSALATGGSIIAGQYLGNNQMEDARDAARQSVWFMGMIAILITAAVYFLKSSILQALFGQISAEVWHHADAYLSIVAASIPFIALYHAGAAVFRAMGNSKLPMKVVLLTGTINVLGSGLCVYGFEMGTIGIAISVLGSRIAAAVIVLALLSNPHYPLHISHTPIHSFQWPMIKRILRIGVPYGVENSLFQLGRILVLSLVSGFGTEAIAANAIAGGIVAFEVLPGVAINMGMTAIIARCIGAGELEQAKYYSKKILRIMYGSLIVMNVLVIAMLPVLFKVYGLSENTASLTREIILLHAVFSVLVWPLAYGLPVAFRAAGDAQYPMVVSLFSMFLCRILLTYILGEYFQMGVLGAWSAVFVDWIVKAVVFTARYSENKWIQTFAV